MDRLNNFGSVALHAFFYPIQMCLAENVAVNN